MEKTLIIGLAEFEFDDSGSLNIRKDFGHCSDNFADLNKDEVIKLISFLKKNVEATWEKI